MAFSISRGCIVLGIVIAGIPMAIVGCSMASRSESSATNPATAPAAKPGSLASKGGAELWAETCSRCHNLRDPSTYSDAQWDVALFDMRVRAQLTGEEQRKILEFLKSAN